MTTDPTPAPAPAAGWDAEHVGWEPGRVTHGRRPRADGTWATSVAFRDPATGRVDYLYGTVPRTATPYLAKRFRATGGAS